jgi:hypothetical protein
VERKEVLFGLAEGCEIGLWWLFGLAITKLLLVVGTGTSAALTSLFIDLLKTEGLRDAALVASKVLQVGALLDLWLRTCTWAWSCATRDCARRRLRVGNLFCSVCWRRAFLDDTFVNRGEGRD